MQLAALVSNSLKSKNSVAYASNWLERLRKIKSFKLKILEDKNSKRNDHEDGLTKANKPKMEDFTEYT